MSDKFECSYEGLAARIATGAASGAMVGLLFDAVGVIPLGTIGAGAGAGKWLVNKAFYCNNDSTADTAVTKLPSLELKDIDK